MREWLSGGVSPCQGEGRGFESRLALLNRTWNDVLFFYFPNIPSNFIHPKDILFPNHPSNLPNHRYHRLKRILKFIHKHKKEVLSSAVFLKLRKSFLFHVLSFYMIPYFQTAGICDTDFMPILISISDSDS